LVTIFEVTTTKNYKGMKKSNEFSEQEIISAIRSKEAVNSALRYLYDSYYRYLERYVLQNSGNEDDAADTIQEAFLVFIRLIEENKFRQESSIKSYLYSITRNLWITELRKRKSMALRNELYENDQNKEIADISHAIIKNESHKIIMGLFAEIGQKCKNILYRFYYEELSMKEIMVLEGFSNEQVLRNKKHKCLKGLIEKIQSDPSKYTTIKNALQHVG
jgi:RNA polymerase sigma factor (sigma-70 family)